MNSAPLSFDELKICQLLRQQARCGYQLHKNLRLSRSTTYSKLLKLERLGVISKRREGSKVIYFLNNQQANYLSKTTERLKQITEEKLTNVIEQQQLLREQLNWLRPLHASGSLYRRRCE